QMRSRVTVCKRLNLKCDRRTPCGSYLKRDSTARCIYSAAAAEKVDVQSLRNRLMNVEGTLEQLTTGSPAQFKAPFGVQPGSGGCARIRNPLRGDERAPARPRAPRDGRGRQLRRHQPRGRREHMARRARGARHRPAHACCRPYHKHEPSSKRRAPAHSGLGCAPGPDRGVLRARGIAAAGDAGAACAAPLALSAATAPERAGRHDAAAPVLQRAPLCAARRGDVCVGRECR
ncbi:hypothetical protein CERSUDRAFT_59700, partial [Gelatoporia subvermispora B]